ncbi:hypothetical protein BpHYR1_016275 [Brachionus plicatilis]|uniref:Uncharacterized protein n=1 Tax=Brachionus plicatilis TaxID=10195 RepID=A0A3M7RKN7_BRAPC|nr:hypothetical protein BpHYR1_016275 [Brachionus plicatilis]
MSFNASHKINLKNHQLLCYPFYLILQLEKNPIILDYMTIMTLYDPLNRMQFLENLTINSFKFSMH